MKWIVDYGDCFLWIESSRFRVLRGADVEVIFQERPNLSDMMSI